jgi:(p)ppGpp synthase/HD superfamily hydrolase
MTQANTSAKIIALAAATLWHEGQLYGDQDYTEAHLLPVAKRAEQSEPDDTNDAVDAYIAGLFHDAPEDGKASMRDIAQLLDPIIGEVRAWRIAEATAILARQKDAESYPAYIERLTRSMPHLRRLVLVVKRADLHTNLDNEPPSSLRKRYKRALETINPHL